ncbi:MAG: hypothetical protein KIT84_11180 [Labilithrix sp.]|nr:hypothetical protein [Labilithrix sp.]MCW5811571.1 hypothetical protein [Labilithrix sp.]
MREGSVPERDGARDLIRIRVDAEIELSPPLTTKSTSNATAAIAVLLASPVTGLGVSEGSC